jgi:lantibiotic modifying enzyme
MNKCIINGTDLANEINNKIHDIAECLINYPYTEINLMGGKAGIALFWAYYSEYSESVKLEKTLAPLISDTFQGIRQGNISPTFASGLAGVGWTIEHLKKNGFIELDTDSLISNFDDYLYPVMLKYIRNGNYDYLHGALGIGLYYLQRTSNPKVQLYISDLVDELAKQSVLLPEGIAWESNLSNNNEESGYNLSLSHGTASIISILSSIYRLNIHREKLVPLVDRAVNFILKNENNPKVFGYRFPGFVTKLKSQKYRAGRLSWCYNDLGISMSLLQAGRIFNNEIWKNEAIETLLETTKIIEMKEAGVMDSCLCHGATGIAHIYNRAYNYTDIVQFRESAMYWFEKSLKIAVYEDGLAGFKYYRTPEYGGLFNSYGFLEGIAGIGLAMISAVSGIESAWDNALLLS